MELIELLMRLFAGYRPEILEAEDGQVTHVVLTIPVGKLPKYMLHMEADNNSRRTGDGKSQERTARGRAGRRIQV